MAVLQMQRISICAMKKNRKAILEELQSLGVLEIDAAELDPELKTMDTMNARLILRKTHPFVIRQSKYWMNFRRKSNPCWHPWQGNR